MGLPVVLKDVPVDVVFSTPSAEALLCFMWTLGREVWGGERMRWKVEEGV